MLPAKFGSIWSSSFRGEDFFNISQSETRIALGGHICWRNGTKWRNFIEAFCQVWFRLVQLFQRSRLKYEKLTDGRQVMAIPHMTLWVRWAKKREILVLVVNKSFPEKPKMVRNKQNKISLLCTFKKKLYW